MSEADRPNLTSMDIQALQQLPVIQLDIDPGAAFELLAVLQLASRHPAASTSGAMRRAMSLAKVLEKHLSVTPALAKLCQAGWNPAFDVPTESKSPMQQLNDKGHSKP